MLNEPNPEAVPAGGDGGTAGDASGGSHMSYIQVTPQEKEAIERVRGRGSATRSPTASSLHRDTQLMMLPSRKYNVLIIKVLFD